MVLLAHKHGMLHGISAKTPTILTPHTLLHLRKIHEWNPSPTLPEVLSVGRILCGILMCCASSASITMVRRRRWRKQRSLLWLGFVVILTLATWGPSP